MITDAPCMRLKFLDTIKFEDITGTFKIHHHLQNKKSVAIAELDTA